MKTTFIFHTPQMPFSAHQLAAIKDLFNHERELIQYSDFTTNDLQHLVPDDSLDLRKWENEPVG